MTMSFYSPYMKGPDFASGIGDISSQIMQMLMMKKMFPDGKKSMGETAVPQQSMMGRSAQMMPKPMDTMQDRPGIDMPRTSQIPMPGDTMQDRPGMPDQDILKKILAALSGAGGGMGGF
jgi:hypothetical protein